MLHRNRNDEPERTEKSERKKEERRGTVRSASKVLEVPSLHLFSPPRPTLRALASAPAPAAGPDAAAPASTTSSSTSSSCCCYCCSCCSRFRLERSSSSRSRGRGRRCRRVSSSSRSCNGLGRRPLGAARRLRRDQPRREPLDALDVGELVRGELEALLLWSFGLFFVFKGEGRG